MKADRPHPAAAGDRLSETLAGLRRATEVIEPPEGFPADVLARIARPRPRLPWWTQLGPMGRRAVPVAALAAAATFALAWSAEVRLDETASALDLAEVLP